MSIIQAMKEKLERAFAPAQVKVWDDSASHYGHDGASPGHVSHVGIEVVSEKFAAMSRVARSRAVHEAVGGEIKQIHALTSLRTLTPEEYETAVKK